MKAPAPPIPAVPPAWPALALAAVSLAAWLGGRLVSPPGSATPPGLMADVLSEVAAWSAGAASIAAALAFGSRPKAIRPRWVLALCLLLYTVVCLLPLLAAARPAARSHRPA